MKTYLQSKWLSLLIWLYMHAQILQDVKTITPGQLNGALWLSSWVKAYLNARYMDVQGGLENGVYRYALVPYYGPGIDDNYMTEPKR